MPSNDLISKKKLLKDFEWLRSQVSECSRSEIDSYIERIKNAPAVDAEPVKHGRWENGGDGIYDTCTYCKESIYMALPMNYCPNCGAKMENPT